MYYLNIKSIVTKIIFQENHFKGQFTWFQSQILKGKSSQD